MGMELGERRRGFRWCLVVRGMRERDWRGNVWSKLRGGSYLLRAFCSTIGYCEGGWFKLIGRIRKENALPIWHTHSTVIGTATALGLKGDPRDGLGMNGGQRSNAHGKEAEDALLAEHYASLVEDSKPSIAVKREPGVEEDDVDMEEMENVEAEEPMAKTATTAGMGGKMVMGG